MTPDQYQGPLTHAVGTEGVSDHFIPPFIFRIRIHGTTLPFLVPPCTFHLSFPSPLVPPGVTNVIGCAIVAHVAKSKSRRLTTKATVRRVNLYPCDPWTPAIPPSRPSRSGPSSRGGWSRDTVVQPGVSGQRGDRGDGRGIG